MLVRISILTACLLAALVTAVAAGTPQSFHVQGVLRDGDGEVVADGPYPVILSGWDDSTGGNILWSENKNIQTTDGLFQVVLDGAGPAGLLTKSGQQYMQVQVSGQAPLSPRIRLASVPSALLSTRMDGDVRTSPGAIRVSPPGSGDPDFDLLRVTAADSTASISMGDPDFDLLRITNNPHLSSISMGGDPDFDLLRVTAGDSGSSITMSGDPDFDLLRITGSGTTSNFSMTGDPDFDLLRMTATASTSSISMGGDPDFDLLRISAMDSTASVSMGGDPDFDLLRITANPHVSSISMGGDPDYDLLRISQDDFGAGMVMQGDPDFDLLRITGGVDSIGRISIGDPDFDLLRMSSGPFGSSIAIGGDPDFDLLRITGSGTTSNFSMTGDPDFDLLRMSTTSSSSSVQLSHGDPDFDLLRLSSDNSGTNIAIEEEGVQVVKIQSGTSSGSGGGGGGSIAIGEEGVQIMRITSDSAGSSIAIDEEGVQVAALTTDGAGSRYNYFEAWPCGVGNVEIGSDGLVFRCVGGGTTDSTASIDKDGNMGLDGDLSVGGDICAVGTIGACSDARYKTDISELSGSLSLVKQMRGVNFNWRTDEFPDKGFRTDRDMGFIAQELKEVVPQVVTLGRDGYYSVDYGRLTPLLVEAVKELDAKTQRVHELEARLSSMEKDNAAKWAALSETISQLQIQLAKLASAQEAAADSPNLANPK